MSISSQELSDLKKALEKEKAELEKELERMAKPVNLKEGDFETKFDDIGSGKEDNATEVDEYTQNLSVETTLEKKLRDINDALEKMAKNEYGKCEKCQKDIPPERLLANPSAKTCLDCSQ
jgi:RNA polymerase-binding protein DksA